MGASKGRKTPGSATLGAGTSVSFVIAAFNEGPMVGRVVEGVRAHTPGLAEVIVVDDGSSDDTARAAEHAGARVIRLGRNRGKGQALQAGIREAVGDVLMFIDADGQDDPAEIPRLLSALKPGVAMVVGSRFLGVFLEGSVTPLHHFGNRFLTQAFNLLYGTSLTDLEAGFRAVRRSALPVLDMKAVRYEVEADVTLLVLRGGGCIAEVPVTRAPRSHGRSAFRSFRDGSRILARMVVGRLETVRMAARATRSVPEGDVP